MPNYSPEVISAIEEAEDSLIGSILIEATGGTIEFMRNVIALVTPGDFSGCYPTDSPDRWPIKARIYHAMTLCKEPPHIINVQKKMIELNMLHHQDIAKMHYCISVTPTCLDLLHYAKAVREYSRQRQAKYYAGKGDLEALHNLTKVRTRKGFAI